MPPGTALSIGNEHAIRADSHGPIGVMGDHMHHAGEWMLSYRYMHMGMEGNRIGDDSVSPDHIVTTVPNRFFGAPMQPPTLRVVPTEMNMDMHMFGAMYAPTDNLTLMAMVTYLDKNMDLLTYQGMMGTTRLGTFSTGASGIGDTKISALYRLHDDAVNHLHLNLGLSLPTGSIDEEGRVLTPMGMRPTMRLPYSMQLGTGTYDLMPGITYTGRKGSVSWGAQYIATLPLESANDEGYAWGDKHEVTAWAAYEWAPWISTSFRIDASTQDPIDGIDPNIVAPVQTANPAFYGGDEVQLLLGANMVGQRGVLRGQRLAFEFGLPVYQDLNGPQMETDWTMTVGWQKSF
ncbi:transporter [Methyloligella sp. GL2]|nr:transporter [Methyloligella sp. GL2]